jgi:aspartate racemase
VAVTVGLVGGLGPESTVDYYRRILECWAREEPGSAPSILIDSLDVNLALRLVAGSAAPGPISWR